MKVALQRFTVHTESPEETILLGEAVGRCMAGGLLIGLVGPLGSGKTRLVKGIARGNELPPAGVVTSPTFGLVHEYPGRLHLYHADAYRLQGPVQLLQLGFDEWVTAESVVVVEWAERVRALFSGGALWVEFAVTGDERRDVTLTASGGSATRSLSALAAMYR